MEPSSSTDLGIGGSKILHVVEPEPGKSKSEHGIARRGESRRRRILPTAPNPDRGGRTTNSRPAQRAGGAAADLLDRAWSPFVGGKEREIGEDEGPLMMLEGSRVARSAGRGACDFTRRVLGIYRSLGTNRAL